MTKAEAKFTLTVGALARRHVVREMREAAVSYKIEIDLQEDKGFLDSHFIVVVTGEDERVRKFLEATRDFEARMNSGVTRLPSSPGELVFEGDVYPDENARLPLISGFSPGDYSFIEAEVEGPSMDDIYLCNILVKGRPQFLTGRTSEDLLAPWVPLSVFGPVCPAPRYRFEKIEGEGEVRVLVTNTSRKKARVRLRLLVKPRFARGAIPGERLKTRSSLMEQFFGLPSGERLVVLIWSSFMVSLVLLAIFRALL